MPYSCLYIAEIKILANSSSLPLFFMITYACFPKIVQACLNLIEF